MKKIKSLVINIFILFASIAAAFLLSEFALRLFTNPVNYLQAKLTSDTILGHKILPGSGGHDKWGFRNKSVPDSSDIVTIGDSQTYGVSATANNSWPFQLATLTNRKVYNLALGGYGPIHYEYLFETYALSLNPKQIIVGFYLGNDLADASSLVYKLDHWKYLRDEKFMENQNRRGKKDKWVDVTRLNIEDQQFFSSARNWLVYHSLLYNLITTEFGNIVHFNEMKSMNKSNGFIILEDTIHNIKTGFTPLQKLKQMDKDQPFVKEGLRLSLKALHRMHNKCSKENIEFTVVIIPSKERVYAAHLRENELLMRDNSINQFLWNEDYINRMIKLYLDGYKINYIDVLNDLQKSTVTEVVYPNNLGDHPNKKVIGS